MKSQNVVDNLSGICGYTLTHQSATLLGLHRVDSVLQLISILGVNFLEVNFLEVNPAHIIQASGIIVHNS